MYSKFQNIETPFYYYDTALLEATLKAIRDEIKPYPHFHVHYAIKANANPRLLSIIQQAGFGVDSSVTVSPDAAISALPVWTAAMTESNSLKRVITATHYFWSSLLFSRLCF